MQRDKLFLIVIYIGLFLNIGFMTYKYFLFKIDPSNYEIFNALLLAILTRKSQD